MFLVGSLANACLDPGICSRLRPAGVVQLWIDRLEDVPANNAPKIRPASAPNWYNGVAGLVNTNGTSWLVDRSSAADRREIKALRAAAPAILERLWRDRQELEALHEGVAPLHIISLGFVSHLLHFIEQPLAGEAPLTASFLDSTRAVEIIALCWLHATEPAARQMLHILIEEVGSCKFSQSDLRLAKFVAAVPLDAIVLKTFDILHAPVDPTSNLLPNELEIIVALLPPGRGVVNPVGKALATLENSAALVPMLIGLLKKSLAHSTPTPPSIRWATIAAVSEILLRLIDFSPNSYGLFSCLLDAHNLFQYLAEGTLLSIQHALLFPGEKPCAFNRLIKLCCTTLASPAIDAAQVAPSIRAASLIYTHDVLAGMVTITYEAQRSDQWAIRAGASDVVDSLDLWMSLASATGIKSFPSSDEEMGCAWKECTVKLAKNKCAGCKITRYRSAEHQTQAWGAGNHKKLCRIIGVRNRADKSWEGWPDTTVVYAGDSRGRK